MRHLINYITANPFDLDLDAMEALRREARRRGQTEILRELDVSLPWRGGDCADGLDAAAERHIDTAILEKGLSVRPELRAQLIEWVKKDPEVKRAAGKGGGLCDDVEFPEAGCDVILAVWVTAYSVQRAYGGPEEGGWYYDHWEALETVKVDSRDPEAVSAAQGRLTEEYVSLDGERRRYPRDLDREVVLVEDNPAESETRERPYYC